MMKIVHWTVTDAEVRKLGHAVRECRMGGFAHGWNVGFGLECFGEL